MVKKLVRDCSKLVERGGTVQMRSIVMSQSSILATGTVRTEQLATRTHANCGMSWLCLHEYASPFQLDMMRGVFSLMI
ncbi:hypothetical protein RRG08_029619 [Elysia crispata]|uniref:Uncharacterized protein n=1 Tax=Elysia crispata TaxID=231223 RepID=A0AAE1CK94_9GAST|nr:hypothetical protein RRG08_029619 [Elysia crispata]